LEDAKTVGEYGIAETSSIVCFATKVREKIFYFIPFTGKPRF
jgi:hypothetical protein